MRIGIDLGGTNVRVALVDDNGIINVIKEPCKSDKAVDEIMDHIKEMIRKIKTPDVTGIGIGVPSAVDPVRGIVYNVMNIPSWKEVHIKEILEKEFSIPVYVNNDANCFVMGEKFYGAVKPYKDIIGITLGTGLGSGLVIDNKLYTGSNTCAGEIGCISYLDYTYEDYCSSRYFIREHNTTGENAYKAAKEGDAEALQIWDEFGVHIANMIFTVLFAYDPQAIVLGGSVANAYELFASSMHTRLKDFMFPHVIDKLVIKVSEVRDVAILGAAALVPK
ncbi:ROK family protein [Dysgonomonas macrotermitis]|uniref:Glucokinase n=1 Tax=Dysgonomonas macrotermitis TaxID=1346286 RepID=A0A1M5FBW6_9BACT|nr:ROK family protein [Dysgonomonas macrotermitis]SHF88939.1 glucokinase [Dysgonomonas macrotermitis]